jgi:hypothetical protein
MSAYAHKGRGVPGDGHSPTLWHFPLETGAAGGKRVRDKQKNNEKKTQKKKKKKNKKERKRKKGECEDECRTTGAGEG